MFYAIKKRIIMSNFRKKKENEPFDLVGSELYTLPEDADSSINNSHFFTAHNNEGDSIVLRLGLRNHLDTELFVILKHGDSVLVQTKTEYEPSLCPATVTCLKPGEEWAFTFDGELKDLKDGTLHNTKIDAVFTAKRPIFDFFYHSISKGMAEAIAREKWTKTYFEEVGKNNQRHYEQTGRIQGTVLTDGEARTFDLACVRDHSFGTRHWDYMNDHIWICGLTENGEALNFSYVDYPSMKKINHGYTDIGEERNYTLSSYRLVDYPVEDGIGPDEAIFECTFENGKTFTVNAKREANIAIPLGGGQYVFQEGIGEFTYNGIKARGTIEYGFNPDKSRWEI